LDSYLQVCLGRDKMQTNWGFSIKDRLMIINADDFGVNHQANKAIFQLLETNSISSASVMVPADSFPEAVGLCKGKNNVHVGIHLTLTGGYKPISPIEKMSTLLNEQGSFHHNPIEVEKNADPEEVRLELQSQIELAIASGLNPTHLDNHQGSLLGLQTGNDFMDIVFDLCEQYKLPFLFPKRIIEQSFFSANQINHFTQILNMAIQRGIPLIDDMISLSYELQNGETYDSFKAMMMKAIRESKPGITQILIHPEISESPENTNKQAKQTRTRIQLILRP
jgi:predicted glycoside hydrolase/deacetylase ChbG (UPF0249 family)